MHFSYLFFRSPKGVSLKGIFLENYNYRTRHSTEFVQSLFSLKTDSLETYFFYIFLLTSVSGYIEWNFFLENHNYRTRHSTEFFRSSFHSPRLYWCNFSFVLFLTSLGGFIKMNFYGKCRTRHSTDSIRC